MSRLKKRLIKYGDTAMVAGAANGLGKAYAKSLAGCGKNLILVDIDEAALASTVSEIQAVHRVDIQSAVLDLSTETAWRELDTICQRTGCRLIVFNAAYGPVKDFGSNSETELDVYCDLNCKTLLKVTWAFARRHQADPKASAVLAMSSMSALRGTMLVSPYAASKAFIMNLMEGLAEEYRSSAMDFMAVVAGPIDTPNFRATNPRATAFSPTPKSPESIARTALGRLGTSAICIPGFGNRLSHTFLKLLPGRWSTRIANNVMRAMYGPK